jgi:hypothetical protein
MPWLIKRRRHVVLNGVMLTLIVLAPIVLLCCIALLVAT